MAQTGFSHACLLVSDLSRALEFYALLGFEERTRVGSDERRSVFCGIVGEAERLQLGPAPPSSPPAPSFGHVALDVEDLDGLLLELADHGIRPDQPPVQAGELRLCFVRDPDGYAIELIERSVEIS